MEVSYECIPPICTKCLSFGHLTSQCPTKAAWVPTGHVVPIAATGLVQAQDSDSEINIVENDLTAQGVLGSLHCASELPAASGEKVIANIITGSV